MDEPFRIPECMNMKNIRLVVCPSSESEHLFAEWKLIIQDTRH